MPPPPQGSTQTGPGEQIDRLLPQPGGHRRQGGQADLHQRSSSTLTLSRLWGGSTTATAKAVVGGADGGQTPPTLLSSAPTTHPFAPLSRSSAG